MQPLLCINLSDEEQTRLLQIARQSIRAGLESGRELAPEEGLINDNFAIDTAVFVTLTSHGELRGCVGSLQPAYPLVRAVANSAYNAAFRDRRFSRLQPGELQHLRIEISVLSDMAPIEAESRQALLNELRVGVDGLLMEDQGYRATFLPRVWEKISSPQAFLDQLMIKAGLPVGHWSSTIRFQRYHTTSFSEK